MKPLIIDTKNLNKEIPKYRTWYRLHDVLFVSVIQLKDSSRKSHFRRKSRPGANQKKIDNDMCQWHSDWQFLKIESTYGTGNSSDKTYEIVVKFNDETHRIDSLVKNLAIEFQHTLTVSINEMESRFIAHNSLGYIPYLILDFTEYTAVSTLLKISRFNYRNIDNYIRLYCQNEMICKVLKQIKKWLISSYFKSNNLFCDFSDYIVRLVPNGENTLYKYDPNFFLNNLLQLEHILNENEENERKLMTERKEKEELKLQLYKEQKREIELSRNKKDVLESRDYHYYRRCLENKYIKEAILNTIPKPEFISFSLIKKEIIEIGFYQKIYTYRVHKSIEEDPLIEIRYVVLGEYKNKEYSFLHSDIEIIKQTGENNIGLRRMTLRQKPKQPIKLISIRNELVKGYLHSFGDYALYLYDENEKIVKKEYYLFNHAVSKSIHTELSDYFISHGGFEIKSNNAKEVFENIQIEDSFRFNFIEYVVQNYLPKKVLTEYYDELDEALPLEDNYI